MAINQIRKKIREFILAHTSIISAEDLTESTPLFSSGILDSLVFVELVAFIEDELKVHLTGVVDVNAEVLDSEEKILKLVAK